VVQDAVYFNQLSAFGGALKHSGDSLDGAGGGFDETIAFDVDKLPLNVNMVAIVVNAHDDGTDFTHVESASCVLQDFPLSLGGKPRQLAAKARTRVLSCSFSFGRGPIPVHGR
jgi:hypothetical protein